MKRSWTCPHNKDVHIVGKCVVTECPYHLQRVNELFKIESKETNCAYYDSDIMQNVSSSRTQISALSRDSRRLLSPKLIRNTFEDARNSGKTLYNLTHEISNNKNCCRRCGYPTNKLECVSTDICNTRRNWVKTVCSQYQVEESTIKFQMIWKLLLRNELFLPQNSLRVGYSLCSSKDITDNPNIPQEYLEKSP